MAVLVETGKPSNLLDLLSKIVFFVGTVAEH